MYVFQLASNVNACNRCKNNNSLIFTLIRRTQTVYGDVLLRDISIKTAAKVFSSAQLSAVAKGDFAFVKKVSAEYFGKPFESLGAFYDSVYDGLSENYRAEYFFKNYLILRHLIGRHSAKTATMLTEFRVGKSKADCVILNGKSTCYEIKTEFDSLNRLDTQLQDYVRLFDEVYVVCSDSHFEPVLNIAPPNVGVLTLNKNNYFKTKRKATLRQTPLDRDMLFKSLRKDEYMALTCLLTGSSPNVANGKIFSACFDVVANAPEELLASCYLKVLKKYRPLNGAFLDALPVSLKNAAVSYQFSSTEITSLTNFLKDKEIPCTVPS